jgi:hypothetical protein
MRRWHELVLLLLLLVLPARAESLAVDLTNASVPTQCAEKDNVTVAFTSDKVRQFRIAARQPAYIGALKVDNTSPDFSHCEPSQDPVFRFRPRQVTLYAGPRWKLVGITYPQFWRGNDVPVRIGRRITHKLHLLQLWSRGRDGDEVLVLYPPDGYWRAHPLPHPPLRKGAYGSSFLLGPIETTTRPFVDIAQVTFDPAAATFRLRFVRGGGATVAVTNLSHDEIALAVTFEAPVAGGPFAMLRSMYVSDEVADVAYISWRGGQNAQQGAQQGAQASFGKAQSIMSFDKAKANAVWMGRPAPSRHNTSAPDMTFDGFQE